MKGLEVNAFTVATEWFLQRQIIGGTVSVYMGEAEKARGFDAVHDEREIRFVVDQMYLQDPKETHELLERLNKWVVKWNEVEQAKRC
tara:strand:+ start:8362 stop:8622 length:261 start_codon:yes stop_codon:yes gene_type:complete